MANGSNKGTGMNKNLKGQLLFMGIKGNQAQGMLTDSGFVVLAGSWINPTTRKSCLKNVAKARREYANKIKRHTLTLDVKFGSSSYAAGFVSGSSRNGKISWHDPDGRTLKELEKSQ